MENARITPIPKPGKNKSMTSRYRPISILPVVSEVQALTKFAQQNLSKMGSQKKEAILQAKWAVNFVKKTKWAKNEL